MTDKEAALRSMTFGKQVAEEEHDSLVNYFVATDVWNRLYSGDIDVVYGAKGSGKSALYTLLNAKVSELFDRGVFLAAAENLRGATAFRDLIPDPPISEEEFKALWKLYFATIADSVFREYDVNSGQAAELRERLAEAGLVPAGRTPAALLQSAFRYVKGALRIGSLEGGMALDPATGLLKGFTGKIAFREPSAAAHAAGVRSVDALLQLADTALAGLEAHLWIGLDRLDVAFADSLGLEKTALRSLFKVYLDLMAYDRLDLKIFLRTDIWDRIVEDGFREASHIIRHATITWDHRGLMSLVAERTVDNLALCQFYAIDGDAIRVSAEEQEKLFYRMCPKQVDVGLKKSVTFDWILSRTQDSTGRSAPREIIHLMNALRNEQVRRLDTGEALPDGDTLFSGIAFKGALPEVSRVRLTQTLYAEHPALKPLVEQLRGEKTSQTPDSLSAIWGCTSAEAAASAGQLVGVGFFEARGSKVKPEYWVPFLYRDALEMVQGAADIA